MDNIDRSRILDNIDELLSLTDYKVLMKKCRDKKMLSDVMQRVIEESTPDQTEQHRKLFVKITKRGPTAYDTLLAILTEVNYNEAYKILKPSYSGSTISVKTKIHTVEDNNNKSWSMTPCSPVLADKDELDCGTSSVELKPFTRILEPPIEVNKAKTFGSHLKMPVYSMCSKQRGVFFLVNIIEFDGDYDGRLRRNGAERDRDNLIALFQGIGGFTIFYYENITQEHFKKLLDELITSNYMRTTDCFVLGILTHGSYTQGVTHILFKDMSYLNLDELMSKFKNRNSIHLLGKPKVFLFPFCRGDITDHGHYIPTTAPERVMAVTSRIEHDAVRDVMIEEKWPSYSDILICYATVVGFMTHRDVENGSWWIQNMCTLWAEHCYDTHVEDLVKMVGLETMKFRSGLQQSLQTDSRESKGFHKLLYLNPGLVSEDDCSRKTENN